MKEHFKGYKESAGPGAAHKDVMKLLSEAWKARKAPAPLGERN